MDEYHFHTIEKIQKKNSKKTILCLSISSTYLKTSENTFLVFLDETHLPDEEHSTFTA